MEGTRRVCDEKCGGTQTQLVGATNHPVVQPAIGSWPQTGRDWPIGLFTSHHTVCVMLRAATQMGSSTPSLSLLKSLFVTCDLQRTSMLVKHAPHAQS